MPIKPRSGEDKDTFVSRCIQTEIKSGIESDQAAAICYSVWEETRMSKDYKVTDKMNEIKKRRQQNLIEPNPCQSGYIAYGTKIKDGREVPNCIPEE